MKYIIIFFLFHFSLVVWGQSSNSMSAPSYGFIENKGQVRDQSNKITDDVKFILPLANNNFILKRNGFSYDTYSDEIDSTLVSGTFPTSNSSRLQKRFRRNFHRVDVQLVNSNREAEILVEGESKDVLNFFQNGFTRQRKAIQAHHYKKVTYKNIYPLIDLEFVAESSPDKPVEYNFIVHPGGNVDDIQMKYSGPTNMKVGRNQLEMKLTGRTLTERIPKSYWSKTGEQARITYKNKRESNGNIIGFGGVSGVVDKELIIDPVPELVWESRITIGVNDRIEDIFVSSTSDVYAAGNALYGGTALSTSGSYQQSIVGGFDALLIKYDENGSIDWATYFGGVTSEGFLAIGERSNGDLVMTGYSESIGIPIVVFSPTGSLIYSGGIVLNSGTVSQDLWIDQDDNIYITGSTGATDLHTPNAPQKVNQGWDGFVAKFSSSFILQWGTYFGGSSNDEAFAIEGDGNGSVAIAGYTMSPDSIATPGSFQTSFGGDTFDAFLAKYSTSGALQWSTYFGGSANDYSYTLSIDSEDNIYLGGLTNSSLLETIGPPLSVSDGFLAKFSSAGARLWSTYYHSTYVIACQIDLNNRLFISGRKWNGGFSNSIILAEFTTEGSLVNSATYNRPAGAFNSLELPIYSIGVSSDYLFLAGEILNLGGGGFQFEEFFLAKFTKPCLPSSPISVQILSSQYSCAMQFAPSRNLGCQINTYAWNFGDGNTATTRNPVHKYLAPGTYTVSLQINYSCGGCAADTTITKQITYSPQPVVLEDTLVEVSTQLKPSVLSASASTFSDTWLLQHEASALADANPFVNGSSGVWRNAASFVYNTNRQYSAPLNLATDGTFSLKQFDWETADFEVVPDWIKATSMTEYSPFSYELENKDVLGVYTAALYDYGGHLPSANGVNMRNKEMAFTGFEFVAASSNNTTPGLTGNLLFGSNPTPDYLIYTINSARGNIAIVEAPVSALDVPAKISLSTTGAASSNSEGRNQVFYGNQIVCLQAHPTRDDWSVVVFRDANSGLWSGRVRLSLEATPNFVPVFDSVRSAHTGKKSLKIQGANQTYKQPILRLDSAKQYVVSAWVAVAGSQPSTPVLANDLGIVVTIKRRNGTTVSTTVVEPTGPIIEGWQQVKGVFACDINNAQVELTFKTGSQGTAWYDDLRIHPEKGNMKSYVYDLKDYRLRAILDEENFASLFYYDAEGNLHITKKETREGIKTINENISYQVERE
jgi:PKD repeat protein